MAARATYSSAVAAATATAAPVFSPIHLTVLARSEAVQATVSPATTQVAPKTNKLRPVTKLISMPAIPVASTAAAHMAPLACPRLVQQNLSTLGATRSQTRKITASTQPTSTLHCILPPIDIKKLHNSTPSKRQAAAPASLPALITSKQDRTRASFLLLWESKSWRLRKPVFASYYSSLN